MEVDAECARLVELYSQPRDFDAVEYARKAEEVRTRISEIDSKTRTIIQLKQESTKGLAQLREFQQSTVHQLSSAVSKIREQALALSTKLLEIERAMQGLEIVRLRGQHEEKTRAAYMDLQEFEKKKLYDVFA